MSIYLGVDTSNYTTSFALCGECDKLSRQILPVKKGERGVRQSDGVFMHIKQASDLYCDLMRDVDKNAISAVGVSTRPRSVDGSYMPVFLPGETFAELISTTLNVPIYKFSHQDGHIMAGVLSCGDEGLLDKQFYSIHLSGGTFEILDTKYNGYNFNCKIVGGTKDISAGQLIDRVGVELGFQFPCGKSVSEYAKNASLKNVRLSVSESEGFVNFSGAEAQSKKLLGEVSAEELCFGVIKCVADSIKKALKSVGAKDVLLVGGVASSDILREMLNDNEDGIKFYYASAELSTDNAWGIAKLAEFANRR